MALLSKSCPAKLILSLCHPMGRGCHSGGASSHWGGGNPALGGPGKPLSICQPWFFNQSMLPSFCQSCDYYQSSLELAHCNLIRINSRVLTSIICTILMSTQTSSFISLQISGSNITWLFAIGQDFWTCIVPGNSELFSSYFCGKEICKYTQLSSQKHPGIN